MKNMMRKSMTLLSLALMVSFVANLGNPAFVSAAATLEDDITSIEFTDINQNSATIELDAKTTKEADMLYYLVTDSTKPISNYFDDNYGFYSGELEQIVVDPYKDLYSNFSTDVDTDIITGKQAINSGSTITLNLNNKIQPNTNYQVYLVAGYNEPGTAQPTVKNGGNTEALMLSYNGSNNFSVVGENTSSNTYVADKTNDDKIHIYKDSISSGNELLVLDIPVNEYKPGDQWVIEDNSNNNNVIPKPHAQFVDTTSAAKISSMVNDADLTQGEIRFSTDSFTQIKDGFGYDNTKTGFYVTGTPSNIQTEWNYTRGVLSGNLGDVTIRFDSNISLTDNGEGIKILDTLTNENYLTGTPNVSNGNELIIDFKPLKPNRQYFVHIPDGAVATETNEYGLGEFNSDVFDRLIFYTEKKPSVVSAYFSPGSDHFDPDSSPFRMSSSDEIYRIPELIGVNKIGVGVNQALVIQFDDKISNLNTGKVSVTTNPVNPDLNYSAEINEDNPTELLITFDTSHPDRLLEYNTKYTVTIESGALKDRYGGGVYSENDKMIFKFKTADGFNNAFMRKTAQELNSGILQTPSENIAIDIPKIYIQQLETIHYRDGLISDERTAPNLTNIKIDAEEDVEKISVVTDRGVRPNLTRGAGGQFSTTFAGLNADVTDIEITAYDAYGKVLERRSFRLQGAPGSEFKNDYVPEITDNFGKIVSLYELMKDPEIMEDVLEQIPVSELDRIGVFQPYFEPYDLITD
ncbi:Ig-like domain-containing protein [Pontibacillus sp. HMF3514]|uniref:Ig-like domain-containing protein n=1 Tax=Pontibacillus sp. HMF3514 TaxID=2692425 RepID=UPI00131FEBA4|nr:Ig-like domain-containing protein [Pontibacillus sp. HMF3514]QHE53617.1 hypothetical protein GS400_17055 [Pontibacillus sp. HMF3514]